jgi:hypothetical protein
VPAVTVLAPLGSRRAVPPCIHVLARHFPQWKRRHGSTNFALAEAMELRNRKAKRDSRLVSGNCQPGQAEAEILGMACEDVELFRHGHVQQEPSSYLSYYS